MIELRIRIVHFMENRFKPRLLLRQFFQLRRQFRIHLRAGVQLLFFSLLPDDPDSAEKDDNVSHDQKSQRLRQQSQTGYLDVNQFIGQDIQP